MYPQRVRDDLGPFLQQAAPAPPRMVARGLQDPGREEDQSLHHSARGEPAGGQQRAGVSEDEGGAREAQLRGDSGR